MLSSSPKTTSVGCFRAPTSTFAPTSSHSRKRHTSVPRGMRAIRSGSERDAAHVGLLARGLDDARQALVRDDVEQRADAVPVHEERQQRGEADVVGPGRQLQDGRCLRSEGRLRVARRRVHEDHPLHIRRRCATTVARAPPKDSPTNRQGLSHASRSI